MKSHPTATAPKFSYHISLFKTVSNDQSEEDFSVKTAPPKGNDVSFVSKKHSLNMNEYNRGEQRHAFGIRQMYHITVRGLYDINEPNHNYMQYSGGYRPTKNQNVSII